MRWCGRQTNSLGNPQSNAIKKDVEMIDPGPGIPPHLALLLNEKFDFGRFTQSRKKLKGMFPDLVDQVRISPSESVVDLGENPAIFRVVMSGGLDLFSGEGSCQALACRVSYADQISRSIALMADQVTMHDYFAKKILSFGKRPTNRQVEILLADLYVLKRLAPLVEAGVLKFISTGLSVCSGCMEEFERRVDAVSIAVLEQYASEINVERRADGASIDAHAIYDPPLHIGCSVEYANNNSDYQLIKNILNECVRSAFWDARDASMVGGVLFSNSRCGVDSLLRQEGRGMSPSDFRVFEGQRAAKLPWVKGLSVRQVVQLREEANMALPALREFMARRLSPCAAPEEIGREEDWIAELREQAAELESVLRIATSKGTSIGRNARGVVGLTISAVSWALEGGAQALSNLLDTLGLVHESHPDDSFYPAALKTKPGYVLVAAKEILAHAESNN